MVANCLNFPEIVYLEGLTRKPQHASFLRMHSDTQAVPTIHCIRMFKRSFSPRAFFERTDTLSTNAKTLAFLERAFRHACVRFLFTSVFAHLSLREVHSSWGDWKLWWMYASGKSICWRDMTRWCWSPQPAWPQRRLPGLSAPNRKLLIAAFSIRRLDPIWFARFCRSPVGSSQTRLFQTEKTMTATDVTGFDAIFSTGFFATFSRFWGARLTKLHREPGEKAKIQWRASSGDGAPKLQISVPCRGRTCPDCFKPKNPRVRKIVCPLFWGQKWVRQFYGRLEFVLSFSRTSSMPIKFLV